MENINYINFSEIDSDLLTALLNKAKIRKHLIDHQPFDVNNINQWIDEKCAIDRTDGCRVRGIIINDYLAGWCGIQCEDGQYEIAIVIDEAFWGAGRQVFNETMDWAREFGHHTVYLHLLHTRPEYRFLRKMSTNVFETKIMNNSFTTYEITVK